MTEHERLIEQDVLHVRARFRRELGRDLNLDDPRTFNEKLQWLKLYRRTPGLNRLVDKLAVRRVVEEKVGSKYLNELYGAFDTAGEVQAAAARLPDAFVIKPNHWSGAVWRVEDKARFDWSRAGPDMDAVLRASFYDTRQGEWCYRGIRPRLLAERLLRDASGELLDYKFFCFHGKAHYVNLHAGRFTRHTECVYALPWRKLPWTLAWPYCTGTIPPPPNLPEMVAVAEALSGGHPFLRVDLYHVQGTVLFGELTLFPQSGWNTMLPPEIDLHLGGMIRC